MANVIQINPQDSVAVALCHLPARSKVAIPGFGSITTLEPIMQGHKVALTHLAVGAPVVKYGFPIGHATQEIPAGSWVHTHNLSTNLSADSAYEYQPNLPDVQKKLPDVFPGFRRRDGKVGIRNEIWILPTVGCVNDCAKALAAQNQHLVQGTVDGLYAFCHPYGCSQTGFDHEQTKKLLAALAQHPNAGAVLVVGLGCENLTQEQFIQQLGEYDPQRIQFLTCQQVKDELEAGSALLEKLAKFAGHHQRQPIPTSELVIGMKCGGSDGLSGITSNPTIGRFSDILCAQGGTTLLTEVPEMFGAEQMLFSRCRDEAVFSKAVEMVCRFKDYFVSHGETVYENPSPGNKAGGITTLEDKSCGCVQKGGSSMIVDVLDYAQPVKQPGLNLLYGPGNDLVSATALAASGAHLVLFSTGRGTPFSGPVPTVKISSNSQLAEEKPRWIDFNTGPVAEGSASLDEMGHQLYQLVLSIASGEKTKNEQLGFRDIAIFKDGVTL